MNEEGQQQAGVAPGQPMLVAYQVGQQGGAITPPQFPLFASARTTDAEQSVELRLARLTAKYTTQAEKDAAVNSFEQMNPELLVWVNEERAKAGLPPKARLRS